MRYASIPDLVVLVRNTTLASFAVLALLERRRATGPSRGACS